MSDLLEMLASETDRRTPAILEGVRELGSTAEPDPERIEALRVEAHGLKGAAMVIGEKRLSDLAQQIEIALVARVGPGTIDPELASKLALAMEAFQAGVQAAAKGQAEPASVGEWTTALAADEPA